MNLQEILDGAKLEYLESGHHHCRPGWLQLRSCPFCGSDNYHLGIHLGLKFCSCWRCGGHNLFQTLQKLAIPAAVAWKYIKTGEALESIPVERTRVSLKEPGKKGPLLASHRRYLEGRGFDPEEISRVWQVEGIRLAARLRWRIYIPVIQKGRRVSWTTRAIGDKVQQRYISAGADEEEVNIKHCIYGLDFCHQSVVVVEGPTDTWKIGPGAGGLFGTAFTPAQVKRLLRFPYRYICFDSSREAQRNAEELADQLSCFPGVTENLLIDAKDPGSASAKEIRLIRKVAKL